MHGVAPLQRTSFSHAWHHNRHTILVSQMHGVTITTAHNLHADMHMAPQPPQHGACRRRTEAVQKYLQAHQFVCNHHCMQVYTCKLQDLDLIRMLCIYNASHYTHGNCACMDVTVVKLLATCTTQINASQYQMGEERAPSISTCVVYVATIMWQRAAAFRCAGALSSAFEQLLLSEQNMHQDTNASPLVLSISSGYNATDALCVELFSQALCAPKACNCV
ncbi:hypothetical protein COO60DRAFT_298819 [Scenedesmus sp. NREL 46B-D3]|nr:hypothetical protein COO60DRAFT_298819 [Scenedesmus sp. NREL 46B-D3]